MRDVAVRFGIGLLRWCLSQNDVISIYAHNCIDTPSVIWGCHWAGLTVAPSSPLSNAREYAFQLKDSGAKAIVTQQSLLPLVLEAARAVGLSNDRIILIGDVPASCLPFQHIKSFISPVVSRSQLRPRKTNLPHEDPAFLCYSSGTTGHPKGVVLTHTNIIANVLQNRTCDSGHLTWHTDDITAQDSKGDKVVAFLPFYHIYGKSNLRCSHE